MATAGNKIVKDVSLYDYALKNNIKTIGQLYKAIEGKKLITIGRNISGHALPKEFIAQPNNVYFDTNTLIAKKSAIIPTIKNHSSAYLDELSLVAQNKSSLKEELDYIKSQQKIIQDKIDLLDELGIDEYDDKVITVITALDAIRSKKPKNKLEEAKAFLNKLETN